MTPLLSCAYRAPNPLHAVTSGTLDKFFLIDKFGCRLAGVQVDL